MRDITKVIDRLIKEIPEDYPLRTEAVTKMDQIKQEVGSTPEEMLWTNLQTCLVNNFSPIGQVDWKHRMSHIFAGNVEE